MIKFLLAFKSQMPNILKRLQDIKKELNVTQDNIKRLMTIEKELSERVIDNGAIQSQFIEMAMDSFGVAMWMKDLNGRFLFANKACCDTILKCTLAEALSLRNGDLKKDALAQVCMRTDLEIMKHKVTKRWIEFALYEDGQKVFIDTIKSPVFDENRKVIGTVGNAVNIIESIPDVIQNQSRGSNSIEIPVNTTLNHRTFAELLERRSQPRD